MGPSGGKGRRGLVADINVTPLVDVMLVLLIIFMVTAPMMTQGIEVKLPETTAKAMVQTEEPIVVIIKENGDIHIGKLPAIGLSQLGQQLGKSSDEKKQEIVYLRADKNVPYGDVVKTMAVIKRAGFEKLGMVTLPDEKNK